MSIKDMGLGKKLGQNVTISDIKEIDVPQKDGRILTKAIFVCESKGGRSLNIDEGWVKDFKGSLVHQAFWVTTDDDGQISKFSTLGKLMSHLEVETIADLIGKEVRGYPKENGFTVICTTDLSDDDFK